MSCAPRLETGFTTRRGIEKEERAAKKAAGTLPIHGPRGPITLHIRVSDIRSFDDLLLQEILTLNAALESQRLAKRFTMKPEARNNARELEKRVSRLLIRNLLTSSGAVKDFAELLAADDVALNISYAELLLIDDILARNNVDEGHPLNDLASRVDEKILQIAQDDEGHAGNRR